MADVVVTGPLAGRRRSGRSLTPAPKGPRPPRGNWGPSVAPSGSAVVPVPVLFQVRAAFFDPVVAGLEVEGVRAAAHDDVRGCLLGGEVEGLLDLVLGEAFGPQVALDLGLPISQDLARLVSHGSPP